MTPITHVRYVAIAVPDLGAERAFLTDMWGLVETTFEDGVSYLTARPSDELYILRLRQAEQRQVDLLSFAATDRAGVVELFERANAKGARIAREPAELTSPGGGFGFRLFDLDGRLIEIAADVATRVPEPAAPKSAIPLGLAHAVFHTPDVAASVGWYEDVLGLRVSDWLDDFMCFVRGGTTKHHCMALLKGPPTLNHIAFEMESIDAMMRGLGRMLKNNVKLQLGPGRHTLGDNTFSYLVAPSGNVYEYTSDIEDLPDDWIPRVLPRAMDVIDQWGTGQITGPVVYPTALPDPALWKVDALDAA